MTTSQTHNGRAQKTTRAKVDSARRVAFEQLCESIEEQRQAAKTEFQAAKYAAWRGAAKRFKGLSDELRLRMEMRNIFADESGYVVSFNRGGETFSRSFYGQTEESLEAALQFRDKALKILGDRREHLVSERVLKALNLPASVPGVTVRTDGKAYLVNAGVGKALSFPFSYVAEEDAYAMAIECLEEKLRAKSGARLRTKKRK